MKLSVCHLAEKHNHGEMMLWPSMMMMMRLQICLLTSKSNLPSVRNTQNESEEQRDGYFLCDDEICFLLHVGIISRLVQMLQRVII